MRLGHLLFLTWACVCSVVFSAPPEVEVYSGTLHHENIKIRQLMRVILFPSETPSQPIAAIVTTHLGSYDDPEYASFYYSPVAHNPTTDEFFLQRNEAIKGRRLPIIHLYRTGDKIVGEYDSPTYGRIGLVELTRGWTAEIPKDEPVLMNVAGTYHAVEACQSVVSPVAMQLERLEILPSRLFSSEHLAPEASLNTINYTGISVCQRGNDAINCGSFQYGTYHAYVNRLMLGQGKFQWNCTPFTNGSMVCDSPYFQKCWLVKKKSIWEAAPPKEGYPSTVSLAHGDREKPPPAIPLKGEEACKSWDGTYQGVLHHRRNSNDQLVTLRLDSFLLDGSNEKKRCAMAGVSHLYFGDSGITGEHLSTVFNQAEFTPERNEQTFFPDKDGDAILHVRRVDADSLEGNWYSKLYGWVGRVRLSRKEANAPRPAFPLLHSISGAYHLSHNTNFRMFLTTSPVWANPESFDPFHQISVTGFREFETGGDGLIPLQRTDTVDQISYDYFTNFVVFRTSAAFLAGQALRNSFRFHPMPRGYLIYVAPEAEQHIYEAFK